MTPETKAQISESMKGNKNRLGYKVTPIQSRRMSRAQRKQHRLKRLIKNNSNRIITNEVDADRRNPQLIMASGYFKQPHPCRGRQPGAITARYGIGRVGCMKIALGIRVKIIKKNLTVT